MGQKEQEIPAIYYILRQSLYRFSNDFNTSSKFLFCLNLSEGTGRFTVLQSMIGY